MTAHRADAVTAPTWRRLTVPVSVLFIAAAIAWTAVVVISRGMGDMPGTMGLNVGAFLAVWALMMTAMMLPTIMPFAALYTRTFTDHRSRRVLELALGYLLVWTIAGLPAYGLAWLGQELVMSRPAAGTALAVAVFAVAGVYQLTPIKDRCLAHCRSPLGSLFAYGNYRGKLRDVRVGVSHGGFCLACCWALMAILVTVGLMNVLAMVVLAAVVLAEKTASWGPRLTRVIGIAALILAIAVVFRPSLAGGVQPMPTSPASDMTDTSMTS